MVNEFNTESTHAGSLMDCAFDVLSVIEKKEKRIINRIVVLSISGFNKSGFTKELKIDLA